MKVKVSVCLVGVGAALLTCCATDDRPPCRRVSAAEFMRPHTFKGLASDQFIGVSGAPFDSPDQRKPEKAFKQIWEMGLFHGWAVIWCPVSELPADYLDSAREKPNRKLPGTVGFVRE